MIPAKRNLLVFQGQDSKLNFYLELVGCDWQIHIARSIHEALDLITRHTFYVGLCLVEDCHNEIFWKEITQLFKHTPNINWVMALSTLPKKYLFETYVYSPKKIFISGHCHDYLTLPVDFEHLQFSLGHAYGMAKLLDSSHREITDYPKYDGIIGNSQVMRKLFMQIEKVCKEDCSVLIQGETGTGKELIANAIHTHSSRAGKPIVAINCGAFPHELIQAELFGYEKGAFTGAQQRRIGHIESAQGGTLFLDEIGDLPLAQQVNLLRFIEERTIERVGGTEKIPIDLRIVSATHVDLKQAMHKGKFREDLYYRLRILHLNTPPLRERENDIELLAWYFFNKFSRNANHKPKGFSVEALDLLQQYDWPGNIRELMNCIRHAVIMSENRLLTPDDLGLEKRSKDRTLKTLEEARTYAECETILASIRHTRNNMSRAAENLGISRVSLYRLIGKYQLNI